MREIGKNINEKKRKEARKILITILVFSIVSLIIEIAKTNTFSLPLVYSMENIFGNWISPNCLMILFALYGFTVIGKGGWIILIFVVIESKTYRSLFWILDIAYSNDNELKIITLSFFILFVVSKIINYILVYKIFKNIFFLLYMIFGLISTINIILPSITHANLSGIGYFLSKFQILYFLGNYKVLLTLVICGTILTLIKNKRVDEEGER